MSFRFRYGNPKGEEVEKFDNKNKFKITFLKDNPRVLEKSKEFATMSYDDYVKEGFQNFKAVVQPKKQTQEPSNTNSITNSPTSEPSAFIAKRSGTILKNSPLVQKQAAKFMSVRPQKFEDSQQIVLPRNFNGIAVWKNFLSPITEQGECGNCWAHASANVLADRFAILSLGQVKFTPSPYDVTICGAYYVPKLDKTKDKKLNEVDTSVLELMDDFFHGRIDPKHPPQGVNFADAMPSAACEGADLFTTANILYTKGVTDIDCFPPKGGTPQMSNEYDVNNTVSGASGKLPYCYKLVTRDFDTCVGQDKPMRKYRAKTAYNVGSEKDSPEELEKAIMYEIYRNGPVVSGFMVFGNFYNPYDGKTIYMGAPPGSDPKSHLGGHAIRIVGWGEDNVDGRVIPYWWIANSWGTEWGINGYFKMRRRIPECLLETNVMALLPDFPGMVITNDRVIPIEKSDEMNIRNFIHSYMDPTSGYYTTAIQKLKECKLRGRMTRYVDDKFPFPKNDRKFFAAEVNKYIETNKISQTQAPLKPFMTCNQDEKLDDSVPEYVPPTISTDNKNNGKFKVSVHYSNDNVFTNTIDTISTHKLIFDILFLIVGVLGFVFVWKITGETVTIFTNKGGIVTGTLSEAKIIGANITDGNMVGNKLTNGKVTGTLENASIINASITGGENTIVKPCVVEKSITTTQNNASTSTTSTSAPLSPTFSSI